MENREKDCSGIPRAVGKRTISKIFYSCYDFNLALKDKGNILT